MSIPPFILAWARRPGPATLLGIARDRAEEGRLGARARITADLTAAERADVGRMLDAAWAGSGDPVPVNRLRQELARHGTTLEDVLVAVGGPLRDRRAEREQERASRDSSRQAARAELAELGGAGLDPAVVERCLVGAASWPERAGQIVRVVTHLDHHAREGLPSLRLPVVAADLFGDAHALDRDTGLGRAVARFLAGRAATPEEPWSDPVGDAADWHAAWELGGVACDGVSAQVLVLNLPLTGDGPAARLSGVAGEPVWLTLRALRHPFDMAAGTAEVFVCENPAIVEAAADRFGPDSRPLVCTFGIPNLATLTLLERLATRTRLRVRADADDVGRRIVARLLRLDGAQPWRMPPDGTTQYEEEVLEELLADLGGGS